MPASSSESNVSPQLPTPGDTARGHSFARELDAFALEPTPAGLSLRALQRPDWDPLCLDWLSADVRRRILAGKKQLLPRAVGLHKKADALVADATAGLGRDGFTLAALGARVILIERHPLMVKLLLDARQRALDSGERWAVAGAQRVEIVQADAREWLRASQLPLDAAHLDPMYPEDGKTALPQKSMQMLRELTDGDDDSEDLLTAALASPAGRIAVKRPSKAPFLGERQPDAQLSATQARYDVYLNRR